MSTPLLTINQLSAAETITGSELTPVYQNNNTFRTSIDDIVDYADATITPPLNSRIDILSGDIFTEISLHLPLAGGTMTGYITAHADPTVALQVATKGYVDARDALRVPLSGGALTGFLSAHADPNTYAEVARKQYVDSLFGASTAAAVELIKGAKAARFLHGYAFEGGAVSQGTRAKFFYLDGLNRLRMSGKDGQVHNYFNLNVGNVAGGGFGQAFSTDYNAYINAVVPVQMESNEYAISAVGAGNSSFIVTNKGNIYCTGINIVTPPTKAYTANQYGFLGTNNTTTAFESTWKKIPISSFGGASAKNIAISEMTMFSYKPRGQVAIINSNNKAYAWGANDVNQISDSSTQVFPYPTALSGGSLGTSDVKQVLPAGQALFAIDSNNAVHVRGGGGIHTKWLAQNSLSTAALATFSACYFVPIGSSTPQIGMTADKIYLNGHFGSGDIATTPEDFNNFVYGTVIALTGGKLWAAGFNTAGGCAQGTNLQTVSAFMPVLSASGQRLEGNFVAVYPSWAGGILAVEDNGTTWGWGDRKSIGIPGTGNALTYASKVPTLSTYNVKKIVNANAQYFGINWSVNTGSCGTPVSVAITTDGRVLTTGSNKYGGNGNGTITSVGRGLTAWQEVSLPLAVSAIDINACAELLYVGTDDGDDDASFALASGIYLLTTDSPEKTLYDIYSFGWNTGYMLGVNQSSNGATGINIVSTPVKVSINL